MKKYFWIFMAICTVLLAGCGKAEASSSAQPAEITDGTSKAADTAEKTLPDKVTAAALKLEGNVLTVKITNDSRRDFSYSESFSLQRQVDGKWQDMPIPEDNKSAAERVVKRFGFSEQSFDLSCCGMLSEGNYRVVTDKFSAEFYADGSNGTTYFYKNGNEWVPEALYAADAPPAMDGISAIVTAQDKNSLTIRLTNWGRYNDGPQALEYGFSYHVEVFLGKRWYKVPTNDTNFAFPLSLGILEPHQTTELTYYFNMYDEFPEGRYRVINDDDFWVEFTAGTEIIPKNSLADGAVRSVRISYYEEYADGSGSVITEYIDKSTEISKILAIISAEPAEKVDNWSGSMVKTPIFGISATDKSGWAFEGAWSNGYWINQNGEAYRLDLDIVELKREIVRNEAAKSTTKDSSIAWLCCGKYLCLDENGWIAARLRPAEYPAEVPENVSAKITRWTANSVTVRYSNSGSRDWQYGEHFALSVQLDGEWYDVPERPGNWGFTDIGINLPAGETREKTYGFYMYGDLPDGRYRVTANGFALEFDYVKALLEVSADEAAETEIAR